MDFSQLAGATPPGEKAFLQTSHPLSDGFDDILRSFSASPVYLATQTQLRPVLAANSLVLFLLEGAEPFDDKSNRLIASVGAQVLRQVSNRDVTRIILVPPKPIAIRPGPNEIEVKLEWARDPAGALPEFRRLKSGQGGVESVTLKIQLKGLS
jgi:hypothetical protein